MKINLKSLDFASLEKFIATLGEKPYRAKQLYKWIYNKGVSDFNEMTDLNLAFREKLEETAQISNLKLANEQLSKNGDTEKFLFSLADGQAIESVLMRYEEDLGIGRVTVCISTQVGCAFGCKFCASGKNGLIRNLESFEIVDQIIQIKNIIKDKEERIANVVLMGIGEPLQNYKNVIKAVRLINSPEGLAIGARHISLSTCGLVPEIINLAKEKIQIKLAVSLHAALDDKRNYLMPVNRKYPLKKLIEACKKYQEISNRRITFEYALIKGFNDTLQDIEDISKLLRGLDCLVNIIPLNNVKDFKRSAPTDFQIKKFSEDLIKKGISATVRKYRGADIEAACGQLRLHHSPSRGSTSGPT